MTYLETSHPHPGAKLPISKDSAPAFKSMTEKDSKVCTTSAEERVEEG
jgi:hypothetical protein